MKKALISLALILNTLLFAQVSFGKDTVTNTSVSVEFADSSNRGLILPYIEDKTGISENGTLIYDASDFKVKYLKNGSWFNLSDDDGTNATTGIADLSVQTGKTDHPTATTVIGANASAVTTSGVLVLSDADKAMVLPKIASPHLNIFNPAPGMIVYDTVTRQLAVYNGASWSFWKP